ncbi:class I SAM-dependent methyltransferase [Planctomicrobium sp. SH527]|uniref:class I SAM-dependent methyltransferase n=1 Tax=Planctomicrobium sp. SH527 TaxID=3448123 RepID=UPI003F5C803D
MGSKDFGVIENDYAFFMEHATEAESDVAVYASSLAEYSSRRELVRLLDFGCGTGDFSDRLLSTLNFAPELLQISLFEPVSHQLAQAAKRLARLSREPVTCLNNLGAIDKGHFDLIISNHVLYYVDDLDSVLRTLLLGLKSGGRMQLAIAGWENTLLQIWKTGFAMLGKPVPYYAAEDVEHFLSQHQVAFEKRTSPYQLRFPNSQENRLRILRFLFGEHLSAMDVERLQAEFEPFVNDGHVEIQTSSDHFVIDGR